MKTMPWILILPVLALLSCGEQSQERKLGKGFVLPEGDGKRGQVAFVELKCHRCHSVQGVELPDAAEKSEVHFALGGEVRKVKTYGELVTAVIQPQHVVSPNYLATLEEEKRPDAPSPMPDLTEKMTVRQMTDLVTFLRPHYEKALPDYVDAPYYTY